MKKIFKQVLGSSAGEVKVELPKNSAILSVAKQHNNIVVYYLCEEDEKEKFTFKFYKFLTGEPLPQNIDTLSYLKTVLLYDGKFVVHVFVDLCALEEAVQA